jgi:hypothetical protein
MSSDTQLRTQLNLAKLALADIEERAKKEGEAADLTQRGSLTLVSFAAYVETRAKVAIQTMKAYEEPTLDEQLATAKDVVKSFRQYIPQCRHTNRNAGYVRCVLPEGHTGNHEDSTKCWWR